MLGEPAFPVHPQTMSTGKYHELAGMSLRDYFAAKALIAMAIGLSASDRRMGDDEVAQCAYGLADAMMRERGRVK